MRTLKVLIADDHRLMLESIRMALESAPGIEVVGEALTGSQVLPRVEQTNPDVVLLDIQMPEMDGLTCLDRIRKRYPDVDVVMLSATAEPEAIDAALTRGARAFIHKHVDPIDLGSALRLALDGAMCYPAPATNRGDSPAREAGLSDAEIRVLRPLAEGLPNKEIAKELWLTEQTVKFHLTSIYRKLGVSSRAEAIRVAYQRGLVENPAYQPAQPVGGS